MAELQTKINKIADNMVQTIGVTKTKAVTKTEPVTSLEPVTESVTVMENYTVEVEEVETKNFTVTENVTEIKNVTKYVTEIKNVTKMVNKLENVTEMKNVTANVTETVSSEKMVTRVKELTNITVVAGGFGSVCVGESCPSIGSAETHGHNVKWHGLLPPGNPLWLTLVIIFCAPLVLYERSSNDSLSHLFHT